jgi:hypothetical protein
MHFGVIGHLMSRIGAATHFYDLKENEKTILLEVI